MNPILRAIVDFFDALAAAYLRRKYGAAAKQLGRLPHEADGRRGFVILEIDGLAYPYLRRALKEGYMPYLARLIRGRRLRFTRWRCGLPSTTPASQAGILYGNNWDIPGFRWYDKANGSAVLCKLPGVLRAIQEQVSAGRAGLLHGGSSYTNLFDGGARLALFTGSALGRHRFLENVRGLGVAILFALSLVRIAKVVWLSLWTWLVYVAKRVRAVVRQALADPGEPASFTFLGAVMEILSNVVFREVTTFCVMVDIYRGMPAIYASYVGYDEIAHHFGADSREALRALGGIDKQIRQIDRIRQAYLRREYDLYILSDHGMTPSVPFRRAHGQTLEQLIAGHTGGEGADAIQQVETGGSDGALGEFLLDEIRGLEARPHRPLMRELWRRARERLEARLPADSLTGEWDLTRRRESVVCNSGPLSHVYFNVVARPMDLSEVALVYPSLLEALAGHPGIGLVVGREGEEVVISGRRGTLWVGASGRRLVGANPLVGMGDGEWAAEQVARLARFPHAGDLILFGAWDGERVVSFEEQVATHGGLGGPQVRPFLGFTPRVRLPARRVDDAEELHRHLASAYLECDVGA